MTRQQPFRRALAFLSVTLFTSCSAPSSIQPDDLRAFASDGCSRFPDGTREDRNLWCHCCLEHDKAYWQGGSREERKAADAELRNCVEAVGRPKTGVIMELGVRAGGSPMWPTRFRWGYGWPYFRGYKTLTAAEEQRAEDLLAKASQNVCDVPDTE